jgi:hypothetical protein
MSLIGALGMLSSYFMQPIIGGWIDGYRNKGMAQELSGADLELFIGTGTIGNMLFFPLILIVLFSILYFWVKGRKTASTLAAEGNLA